MPLKRRWAIGIGSLALVFLGVGLLVIALSRSQLSPVTQQQIDAAVQRSLASATPAPSYQSLVYATVARSVVTIVTQSPGRANQPNSGVGAGVVVDSAAGIILTSLHVIEHAQSISVAFADGTRSNATVINTDAANDIAVLQVEIVPDDLEAATLASVTTLRIGDQVVAIGAPLGLAGSLSSGVVSGLGRTFNETQSNRTLQNMIQFDAAVNPGNSGGPLVDRNGDVVGIVTGLANATGAPLSSGIGYAVPIPAAGGAAGQPWY